VLWIRITLIWNRIRLSTVVLIRILAFIKVMRICDHCSTDPHGSILSLFASILGVYGLWPSIANFLAQSIQGARLLFYPVPSRRNWVSKPLHPQESVAPPPLFRGGGGGQHSLAGEGVVGPYSDDGTKTLVPGL
jgi:hypothetical protein